MFSVIPFLLEAAAVLVKCIHPNHGVGRLVGMNSLADYRQRQEVWVS
ncbi:RNA polymerase subunit sigma-70 [Vibrio cholerae]|nr:RNA polymerase subunit sigma-70 [Vibrio cholerae]MVB34894.1 RNA polymerase subunit sigma-70 [Vibrio cholerae]MVB52937.1 RNA polymerase subunit sigma-70 [Vibrio cholerae]MVB75698.1 RNA polymerase subunit sigma-70 [Vibrio cholerae]MVB77327.1 RNA polymerase subunit sigma-70 [Vibrio cholerae]